MALRPFVLAVLAVAACDVGSVTTPGGDDDDTTVDAAAVPVDAPIPTFAAAITPATAQTTLGTETTYQLALTSSHFAGAVALTASGVPADWIVTIDPATVVLTDGGTASASIRVRVPSNATPAATGATLRIDAAAAVHTAQSTATLAVTNEYIVGVGASGTGPHWGAMNGGTIRIKAGTRLHIRNTDTIAHRIHTGGGVGGFGHQGASMGPGGSYDVTPTDGSDIFYCHDHGQGTGEVNLVIE